MYTSVHYVVESNSNTRATCEIQVRTLAEELGIDPGPELSSLEDAILRQDPSLAAGA